MKVKNDHRSKFSNLSNWKEEASEVATKTATQVGGWGLAITTEFDGSRVELAT